MVVISHCSIKILVIALGVLVYIETISLIILEICRRKGRTIMKDCTADKKGSDTQVIEYSSPVKIFIVDNDGCFGRSLAELLRASGYFALLADSTDEARAIIRNNSFDIIISDASMPGMTCAELIIYSKKYQPLLEVIITSRTPEFAEALQAARDGAFDYIGKNGSSILFEEKSRRRIIVRSII